MEDDVDTEANPAFRRPIRGGYRASRVRRSIALRPQPPSSPSSFPTAAQKTKSCRNTAPAAMEDVLAVYTRPHDPERPLVCVDETSKQLVAQTRSPIPTKPGRPVRVDYEYERN